MVERFPGIDRPASSALMNAIEKAIDDVAEGGEITPIEILGVLDIVGKRFYKYEMRDDDEQ